MKLISCYCCGIVLDLEMMDVRRDSVTPEKLYYNDHVEATGKAILLCPGCNTQLSDPGGYKYEGKENEK